MTPLPDIGLSVPRLGIQSMLTSACLVATLTVSNVNGGVIYGFWMRSTSVVVAWGAVARATGCFFGSSGGFFFVIVKVTGGLGGSDAVVVGTASPEPAALEAS